MYAILQFAIMSNMNKLHPKANKGIFNPNNLSAGSNMHTVINNISTILKSLFNKQPLIYVSNQKLYLYVPHLNDIPFFPNPQSIIGII